MRWLGLWGIFRGPGVRKVGKVKTEVMSDPLSGLYIYLSAAPASSVSFHNIHGLPGSSQDPGAPSWRGAFVKAAARFLPVFRARWENLLKVTRQPQHMSAEL